MLISIHIPKTAGTAWRLHVEANAGARAGFVSVESRDRHDPATCAHARIRAGDNAGARAILDQAGCTLVHGHQAPDFLDLLPDAPAMLWLRDPYARLRSEFLHLRRKRRNETAEQGRVHDGEIDFADYVRPRRDLYARLLGRLDKHPGGYAVFLTERSEAAARAFHEALGWRGRIPARNVTPVDDPDAPPTVPDGDIAALLAGDTGIHRDWLTAWDNGDAADAARRLLSASGAGYEPAAPALRLRRRIGVWKEGVGRLFGRDWR